MKISPSKALRIRVIKRADVPSQNDVIAKEQSNPTRKVYTGPMARLVQTKADALRMLGDK